MSTDLARFANQLKRLSDAAWTALDNENADRQLLLEALIDDTAELAARMNATAEPCDIPECPDHCPFIPTGTTA